MIDLVERLKAASAGVAVWRIMSPDGKLYIDEMGDERVMWDWLRYQQRKGNYEGFYVDKTTRYDSKDRLMQEAAAEIERLRQRIADLGRKIGESVEGAG